MLRTENSRFSRYRSVAGPMNALLAILPDAQFPDGLKALDNPDQVLLARRFRPFTQPCERCPVLVVADRKQCFQPGDRFEAQSLDKILVRPLPGTGARGQADAFQYGWCRQQNAVLPQMVDQRGDNGITPVGASRLVQSDLGDCAIILTSEGTDAKIFLQLAEMLSASFLTAGILVQRIRLKAELSGHE